MRPIEELIEGADMTMEEHLRAVEQNERKDTLSASKAAFESFFKTEKIDPSESLMEIGTGLGYLGSIIPKRFRQKMLQTDIDERLLEEARKRCPDGKYKVLNCADMPEIADASMDRIFAMNVFNAMSPSQIPVVVAECARVLKPGGHLYGICDLQPDPNCVIGHMEESQDAAERENLRILGFVVDGIAYVGVGPHGQKIEGHDVTRYFIINVLEPFFKERFSEVRTELMHGSSRGLTPLHAVAAVFMGALVVTNANRMVRDMVDENLGKSSPLLRKVFRPRHIKSPREVDEARLGSLRKIEVAGLYLTRATKNAV